MDWHLVTPPPQQTLPADTVWVLYTLEPPSVMNATFWANQPTQFDAVFSYQRASDVFVPYGCYKPKADPKDEDIAQMIGNKTRLVAWMASNCHTQSDRARYYKDLRKYIQIDVFGACGNLTCQKWGNYSGQNPCGGVKDMYKFYFSFENSICTDYVTEKVWRTLGKSVPIVLGGADYKNILPPNSFIDVRDFKSAKDLANYLLELDQNMEKYSTYFHWTKYYRATKRCLPEVTWKCDLCRLVNNLSSQRSGSREEVLEQRRQTYHKIQLLGNTSLSCQNPDDYYREILVS